MIIPFTQGIPKIWTCSACSLEDTPLKFVTWNLKMAHSKRRFTFFIIRFYLELWRCTDVYCNYQLIYVRTLLPRNSVPDWSVNSFLFLGNNMTWLDLVLFFWDGTHLFGRKKHLVTGIAFVFENQFVDIFRDTRC